MGPQEDGPRPGRFTNCLFGWWFRPLLMFTPIWGNDPILTIIFFKWVGSTTNQLCFGISFELSGVKGGSLGYLSRAGQNYWNMCKDWRRQQLQPIWKQGCRFVPYRNMFGNNPPQMVLYQAGSKYWWDQGMARIQGQNLQSDPKIIRIMEGQKVLGNFIFLKQLWELSVCVCLWWCLPW